MLSRKVIGYWLIEYDPKATNKRYLELLPDYSHIYWRNFLAASSSLPLEMEQLLSSLGTDIKKPIHLSEMYENPDGTHFYILYYDVVGRTLTYIPGILYRLIIKRNRPIAKRLCNGVDVIVRSEASAPYHFPGRIVELEFLLNIPWIYKE